MSIIESIVKAVAAKFRSQGIKVTTSQLTSDWKSAEKCLNDFLVGSILLGLNEMSEGFGNLLLFARPEEPAEIAAVLEVGGAWIWNHEPISSLLIRDTEPFSRQEHAALISSTAVHIGHTITAFKLWEPLPHLALEFSDQSVLAIHGDNGQYESWGFDKWSPNPIGVYALPGGPIAVG